MNKAYHKIFAFAMFLLTLSATARSEETGRKFPELKQKGKTAIVAHRGFWKCEESGNSQNSIASLRQAQATGLWGSECDIHLTSDDIVIVNHDNSIDGLKIAEHTYAELSSHLLKNGEKIPTLEEYLAQHSLGCENTVLVIEFKKQPDKSREDLLVKKALALLKGKGLYNPSQVAFISFSMFICKEIAATAPEFVNQYLNGDIAPKDLAAEGINGIDYRFDVLHKHPEWVKEAHSLGMSVNVWTVNNENDMRYFMKLGVDAITTNEPLAARKILSKKEFLKAQADRQ